MAAIREPAPRAGLAAQARGYLVQVADVRGRDQLAIPTLAFQHPPASLPREPIEDVHKDIASTPKVSSLFV